MATTDLHGHLLPYDYYTDTAAPQLGLARLGALIAAHRRSADNLLLVDNGDLLQGTPMVDVAARELDRPGATGLPHPMIAAMNALGYDAATLGNHDFDYGLPLLRAVLRQADFPIVSANVAAGPTPGGHRPLLPAVALLDRVARCSDGSLQPLRIGVIGFAPPQIADWGRYRLGGEVRTRDIIGAARDHLPKLRAAGADLVIALAHCGIGSRNAVPGMENAAVPLAALPGIDALIIGHTHQLFPTPGASADRAGPGVDPRAGTLHGKPAVMPGFFGSHLGVIELLLDRHDDGWRVAGQAARLDPAARHGHDPQLLRQARRDPATARLIRDAHRRTLAQIRRPVGHTTESIFSHFALAAPDPSLSLVADAQRVRAQALLAGTRWSDLPLISVVTPYRAGGRAGPTHYIDIPPGPLLARHASELYTFSNTMCLSELTAAEAADWLEQSASLFARIEPGQRDQPLLDPEMPSYGFDVLDGLRWRIDPSRPARCDASGQVIDPRSRRVDRLSCGGRLLAPDDRLVVVTNNYRLGAEGGVAAALRRRVILQESALLRDVVLDHLSQPALVPEARPCWRFVPLPGTAAWFDSAPAALTHLAQVAGHGISAVGPAPDGFHRFRLEFDPQRPTRGIDSPARSGYPEAARTRTLPCPAHLKP